MSDFAQHGLISTLQCLTENQTPRLERELEKLGEAAPVALVLPCHFSELERPALGEILEAVSASRFIREVIVGLNGAGPDDLESAREFFSRLRIEHRMIWTGHSLFTDIPGVEGTGESVGGKGMNLWACLGSLLLEGRCRVAMTLDCDVTSSTREMMSRLAYAVLHPDLDFAFAKAYYSRVSDRMYGRVTRLLIAPLLQALVRVAGHAPMLDFLSSFRYALSGESAFRIEVAETLPLDTGWGVEMGLLCDLFREVDPRAICQVEGGAHYEHKHQDLSAALSPMAAEIVRVLFRELTREGLVIDSGFQAALEQSYYREAREALRRSRALAMLNGLPCDAEEEERAVGVFGRSLAGARKALSRPKLPSWNRLRKEAPDFVEAFRDIVAESGPLRRVASV